MKKKKIEEEREQRIGITWLARSPEVQVVFEFIGVEGSVLGSPEPIDLQRSTMIVMRGDGGGAGE